MPLAPLFLGLCACPLSSNLLGKPVGSSLRMQARFSCQLSSSAATFCTSLSCHSACPLQTKQPAEGRTHAASACTLANASRSCFCSQSRSSRLRMHRDIAENACQEPIVLLSLESWSGLWHSQTVPSLLPAPLQHHLLLRRTQLFSQTSALSSRSSSPSLGSRRTNTLGLAQSRWS